MAEDASWFLFVSGAQQGPLTENQVNEMIRAGQVDHAAKVVGPGHEQWTPIAEVMAFAPLLSGFGSGAEPTEWMVSVAGAQQGPYPEAAVSDMIRAGQLSTDALVQGPGTPAWTPIEQVVAFAALLRGFGTAQPDERQDLASAPVAAEEPWMRLPGWNWAYKGLNMYYKAILLSFLMLMLMIAFPLAALAFAGLAGGKAGLVLLGIYPLLVAGGWATVAVMMLLGLVFYTRMPPEAGAKGMATAATVLCAVALLATVLMLVSALVSPAKAAEAPRLSGQARAVDPVRLLGSMVSGITGVLGLVALLLSMMKAAAFIGQPTVVTKARSTLLLFVVTFGAQIALGVYGASEAGRTASPGNQLIALVASAGLLILSIVCLFMFLSAVNAMRTALMVADT